MIGHNQFSRGSCGKFQKFDMKQRKRNENQPPQFPPLHYKNIVAVYPFLEFSSYQVSGFQNIISWPWGINICINVLLSFVHLTSVLHFCTVPNSKLFKLVLCKEMDSNVIVTVISRLIIIAVPNMANVLKWEVFGVPRNLLL